MSLRLRDVTNDDLPLIGHWLHADHVHSTWGDPDAHLRLLNEPPASGNWRAIIREFDDVPNGLHVLMVRHRQKGQVA